MEIPVTFSVNKSKIWDIYEKSHDFQEDFLEFSRRIIDN